MPHRYSRYFPAFILIFDIAILNITFLATYNALNLGDVSSSVFLEVISVFNIAWACITFATRNNVFTRPLVYTENIVKVVTSTIIHMVVSVGVLYFLQIYDFSRLFFLIQFGAFTALLSAQRICAVYFLHLIRSKGYNKRKVWLIGDLDIINRVEESFNGHPEYGYNLVKPLYKHLNEYSKQEVKNFITFNEIDEVFICFKEIKTDFINDILEFEKMGVKIKMISDLQFDAANTQLLSYDKFPVIYVSARPFTDWKVKFMKRAFDLVVSSSIMIAGLPIFLLILIITKITSRGTVFYKQQRIGKNGTPFYIYKFRSMYSNAEHMGPQLSKDNDPRITKWGRIMRKTRLDELPQFFNVFMGQMSIVGPRPERRYFIEQIIDKAPQYKKLLSIKPGITSIGQVRYGYAENVDQMIQRMKFDQLYLKNQGLLVDVGIILETVKVMVQGKGK